MAGVRTAQGNFTKGEISPEVEARFDLDIYHAALRKASNVIIRRTGGVRKRPGSRFVTKALSSSSRLFPFQFSDSQAYALLFDQGVMQPLALGGAVLETGLKVTAITKATNAKITTAGVHGYVAGDPVWFDSILGMVEINNRFLQVMSVIDANNFTVNFDSTNASTFTGDTGGETPVAPPPAPTPAPTPSPTPTPTPPPVGGGGSGSYGSGGTWHGGTLSGPGQAIP